MRSGRVSKKFPSIGELHSLPTDGPNAHKTHFRRRDIDSVRRPNGPTSPALEMAKYVPVFCMPDRAGAADSPPANCSSSHTGCVKPLTAARGAPLPDVAKLRLDWGDFAPHARACACGASFA
jgi:hypothetical protein